MPIEFRLLDVSQTPELWTYFNDNGWLAPYRVPAIFARRDALTSPRTWQGDFDSCVARLRRTTAGAEIFERVSDRVSKLNILAVPGVASCFICTEEFEARGQDALKRYAPLVAIDPAIPFAYLVVTLKPLDVAKPNPTPLSANVALMPPWLVLGHELGHAVQWAYNYSWFCSRLAGGVAEIEADNLTSHEQPLCAEVGLPRRRAYKDFLAADSTIGAFPFGRARLGSLITSVRGAFTTMQEQNVTPTWGARNALDELRTKLMALAKPDLLANRKTHHFGDDQTVEHYNSVIVPELIDLLERASPKSTLNPAAAPFVPQPKPGLNPLAAPFFPKKEK